MYPVRPYFPRSEGEAHARRGHTPRTEGDVEVAATSGTQAAEVPFKMEHRSEGQTFLDEHDTPAGRGGSSSNDQISTVQAIASMTAISNVMYDKP